MEGERRGVITRAQIQHLLLWIVILILWYNFELKKDDFWGLFLVLMVCAFSWHPLRKMCNFLDYCCYYCLWKINTDLVEELKSSHKCLFSPSFIKGRAQCYAAFHWNIHEYLIQVKCDIWKTLLAWVESTHFLAWYVAFFPNVIKTLLYSFRPFITLYIALRSAFYRCRKKRCQL